MAGHHFESLFVSASLCVEGSPLQWMGTGIDRRQEAGSKLCPSSEELTRNSFSVIGES